jgi:UDP-glucose 4-epimerase
MRVAITGATGNVGTALIRALADEERVTSILGIARRRPATAAPKVEWVAADVSHDGLAETFAGADCVVHLAWLIQPSRDRQTTWTTNVVGSRNVFEAAAEASVASLVYASSVGAYSPAPKTERVDESWPTEGIASSFYSRDKAEVERVLDTFERVHPGIRVVRLRPSLIFQREMGKEVKRLFTGRLVPHRLLAPSRIPFVPSTPQLVFQAVHADDVADAYRRAIVGDASGAFNIASEPVIGPANLAATLGARPIRVPEKLLRALVAATWRAHLQPTPPGWVDLALCSPIMRTDRARAELGWEPRRSSTGALLEVVEGFHEDVGAPTPPLTT